MTAILLALGSSVGYGVSVAVLGSLAKVVTAVCAHALTTERPAAAQTAGAALAVLGTLVVSAARGAA